MFYFLLFAVQYYRLCILNTYTQNWLEIPSKGFYSTSFQAFMDIATIKELSICFTVSHFEILLPTFPISAAGE